MLGFQTLSALLNYNQNADRDALANRHDVGSRRADTLRFARFLLLPKAHLVSPGSGSGRKLGV